MAEAAPIQIVDKHDQPAGQASKEEAWVKGLRHRVVRLMIEDDLGRVLLQHRAPGKIPFPTCWDNSVAGHVDASESYEAAIKRELEEELGIYDAHPEEIGYFASDTRWQNLKLNRFTRVYKVRLGETPHRLQAEEVDKVQWFAVDDVKQLIRDHPDQVTDGLKMVMERYY